MEFPGGFRIGGPARDTRPDYPQDVSRVVTSVPTDADNFYPDSDQMPGAVRTAHGHLSFIDGVEDAAEEWLGSGAALPDHIKRGLTEPPKPVEVKLASRPGGDEGRVVKMLVPGGIAGATRLFTANANRRSVMLYNDGVASVYWGYTEAEASGGQAGNGFTLPVGTTTVIIETQKELWFSTDQAAPGVYIRTATVGSSA